MWKEDGDVRITYENCGGTARKLECAPSLDMMSVTVKSRFSKLIISGSGEAAAQYGVYLGLYEYRGELNGGGPYYVQTGDGRTRYLYRDGMRAWRVDTNLSTLGYVDCSFYHAPTVDTDTPPHDGWQYRVGWQYEHDPSLEITPGPLSPLQSITVKASGDVAAKYPNCLGTFTLTDQWICGRPVYMNERGKYLSYSVCAGWSIEDLITLRQMRYIE